MMRPHAPLGSESDTESDYDDLPGLVSQSDSSDSDSDDELQLEREDPEPELELEDPEPELELEDPEPELELEEPEPDLSLVERMRGGTDEPAVGTTPQRAADSRGSAYGLTSGRFTVHSSSDGDAARPSLLTYHEEDAHLFPDEIALTSRMRPFSAVLTRSACCLLSMCCGCVNAVRDLAGVYGTLGECTTKCA